MSELTNVSENFSTGTMDGQGKEQEISNKSTEDCDVNVPNENVKEHDSSHLLDDNCEVSVPTEQVEEQDVSAEQESVHDPYFYTKRDEFTSEIHKIEIGNLPKLFGHGQLKKLLGNKLKLNPHKIKIVGQAKFAFVSFRSEQERERALHTIEGYTFKGRTLTVKKANPMADPLVQKRKLGEAEECVPEKRQCEGISIPDRIKESVAAWSDIPYEKQLEQKEEQMKRVFIQYGRKLEKANPRLKPWISKQREAYRFGVCELLAIRGSPETEGYRNKNEFSVGCHPETGEPTVGFRLSSYKMGSMSVADPDHLSNVPGLAKKVAKSFQEYVRGSGKEPFNPETHAGYWRQLTVRTTRRSHIMAIAVIHPQTLNQEEILEEKEQLKKYFTEGPGMSCQVTSFYLQKFDKKRAEDEQPDLELVFGTEEIEETLLGQTFQVGPDAFFQVNTAGAEVLYQSVQDVAGLDTDTTLLDICCGTGTIGLSLAAKVNKVYGVDICKRAIQNAKRNAEANGIHNASFVLGKAEDTLPGIIYTVRNSKDIVAIVDPPRQGLHNKVIKTLRSTSGINKLVYVSCNPEGALQNFVDLGRPASNSYKGAPFVPVKAVPVDMFPHTPHCELVLLLERLQQ